jgi:hypothetical protein
MESGRNSHRLLPNRIGIVAVTVRRNKSIRRGLNPKVKVGILGERSKTLITTVRNANLTSPIIQNKNKVIRQMRMILGFIIM